MLLWEGVSPLTTYSIGRARRPFGVSLLRFCNEVRSFLADLKKAGPPGAHPAVLLAFTTLNGV